MKDEFAFIQSITPAYSFRDELINGIGDDAALYRIGAECDEIACTDTMVEGIHFKKDTMTPFQIGRKALAVNISDVAAMGGIPLFYLVSLSVPNSGWSTRQLKEIYRGLKALGDEFQMDMIGGDTVSTRSDLHISVTVIGKIEKGRRLLRSNARPGDVVFLTGPVGGSAAGLSSLLSGETNSYISYHQEPNPRVKQGRILAKSDCRISLNDVSDGIASESHEISEASGVSIVLEQDLIPAPEGFDAYSSFQRLEWMLNGGEDYELIGTVAEADWKNVEKLFLEQKESIYRIGYVEDKKPGVWMSYKDQKFKLDKKGYNHFSSKE
ncbi:thiamine-phosphate kinase [Alkalihalobacillus macyae]|uniref:thiamine-phosphate kinase n=1 Tax=Guptibacillus hwajinpoensis TaxID=208199 RepID=UPI00273A8E39|nr:thiamine-phosphate kinase [Alkalihalobacillus macyae]MDP4553591.1 thiamine-phosphate kinase [Alkalihalobacillus macyae]